MSGNSQGDGSESVTANGGGEGVEAPAIPASTDQTPVGSPTLTQHEVDRIIPDRARRMVQSQLSQAGFQSWDELIAMREELETLRQAQMTEQERQLAQLQQAQEQLAQARQQQQVAAEQAELVARRAAVTIAAASAGALYPNDAFALIDMNDISVDTEGVVVGADGAVMKLIQAGRLPLHSSRGAPSLDAGAGTGQRPSQVVITQDERDVAAKMGVTAEDYARYKKR